MKTSEDPSISLVMCTIGSKPACLRRLIASLEAQSTRDFELIVVDQSPLGTLDALIEEASRKMRLRYLRSPVGLSRARNIGLQHCRGRFVAFPDDDCWYPPDLLQSVVSMFWRNRDVVIFTGRTVDAGGRNSNGRFHESSRRITAGNVWFAGNSNSIFACAEVAVLLGFDETLGAGSGTPFGSGEETDFLLRAIAGGAKIEFLHDLVVHHDQVDASIGNAELVRAKLYARGYGRVLRLNDFSPGFALLRSSRSLAGAVIAGLRGDFARARHRLRWAAGIVAGYAVPEHRYYRLHEE